MSLDSSSKVCVYTVYYSAYDYACTRFKRHLLYFYVLQVTNFVLFSFLRLVERSFPTLKRIRTHPRRVTYNVMESERWSVLAVFAIQPYIHIGMTFAKHTVDVQKHIRYPKTK